MIKVSKLNIQKIIKNNSISFFLISVICLLLHSNSIFADENSNKNLPSQKSIEDFPITGTDPLFESLLIEFSQYSRDKKVLAEWFYTIAEKQKNIDYARLAFREANFANDQPMLDKAGKLWLDLSKNQEDKLGFFYTSIVVFMNQNKVEQAKENLDKIMLLSSDKNQVFKELIVGFNNIFKQNSNHSYLDLIDLAINYLSEEDKANAYFESAKIAFSWKNTDYAIYFSDAALAIDENNINYKLQKLGLLANSEKYQELVQFFNQSIKSEDYPSVSLQVINIFLVTTLNAKSYGNQFEPVIEYLIENKKDTAIDRYMYGVFLIEKNRVEEAKIMLESVVNVKTKIESSAFFNLASAYALLGEFEKSVEYYNKVTNSEQKQSSQFFGSLIAATHFDDQKAKQYLKQLYIDDKTQFINTIEKLAEAYKNHGRLNLLVDYLDFILKNYQNDEIQIQIGLTQSTALYLVGDFDRFEKLIFNLVEQYPNNANFLNTLGYYYLDKKNDIAKAEPYINLAYQLDEENSAVIDSMGWLYFKKQDYKTALSYISKAYSIHPHPEILAHLIEVLFNMKEENQAQTLLVKALNYVPENNYLLALRDRLFPHIK